MVSFLNNLFIHKFTYMFVMHGISTVTWDPLFLADRGDVLGTHASGKRGRLLCSWADCSVTTSHLFVGIKDNEYFTYFQLLMLTTNMIRKDLNSQNQYDAGLALSGLSCFISPDLARDLANDIMTLVSTFLFFL
jgi:hypothetical protein